MVTLSGICLLLQIGAGMSSGDLQTAVNGYWELLAAGDKRQALEFVAPESQNAFIQRREPFFRSWKIEEIRSISPTHQAVTVEVQRLLQGRFQPLSVTENWVEVEGQWKVKIPDYSHVRTRLWVGKPQTPQEGVLEVLPRAVKIHFLSPTQRAAIVIRNGLSEAVRIVDVGYDTERFRILGGEQPVPPGGLERILVRYTGAETAKNQHSRVVLVLEHNSEQKTYSIPITYNLVSPAARALLGLSPERAELLEKTDVLRPDPRLPDPVQDRGHPAGDREKRPMMEPQP